MSGKGNEIVPLGLLREGEVGEIYSLPDLSLEAEFWGGPGGWGGWGHCFRRRRRFCQRISSMGLKPGQIVEVKQNRPGNPMLLKVGETFIALSRRVAMGIKVLKRG